MKEYNLIIQIMIQSLVGKSVTEQLKSRYVRLIKAYDFGEHDIKTGRLSPSVPTAIDIAISRNLGFLDFVIELNERDCDDFGVWRLVLGHELGHTFEYGIDFSFPIWWPKSYKEGESFCDLFSERWIETGNNKIELNCFLEKLKKEGDVIL